MKLALTVLAVVGGMETLGLLGACPKAPQAGEPLNGLTPEQLASFNAGKVIFEQKFEPENGLGPLFNADACSECHEEPVTGGNGDEDETHAAVTMPDGSCDMLAAHGGPVFQAHTTPALERALGIDSEPIPAAATTRATRSSPDVFGFGLLEAVPDREIVARADPNDRDHDGVSGRPHYQPDGRVGRFGRKAAVARLDDFNGGAFVIEMGITNPVMPNEESIGGAAIPAGVDSTAEPELSAEGLASVVDFIRFLAPPPPLPLSIKAERGRAVFRGLGCASCHTPALVTGPNRVRALDRKVVAAYSDLLLHDMGAARADICIGQATPAEFRTEPLMGLRFAKKFLHDGAASTLEEAIQLHDGEAARARQHWDRATPYTREALLEFLKSL